MLLLRCYPKVTDWIYEVFNQAPAADYRFLPIYSYGFWVAVGFLAAASLATLEMRRREKLGLMPGKDQEITVGNAPNMVELSLYFIIGFVLLFKLVGIVVYRAELSSGAMVLKDFMLSFNGSWVAGIIGGAALAYYYYSQRKKEQLPQPEKKIIKIYPSDGVGDLVVIAAILGVLGSILFNFLESPGGYDRFWEDPVGFLTSGLSIYGGLICAGLGFAGYAWYKKIPYGHFFDSIAPGFILANGLGRIGCQTSGDGDWGLINTAPKPGWMPQWLWANNYAHNIVNEGVPIAGCTGDHCTHLVPPVYPTPMYEFLMCTAIFLILWSLRKKLTPMPGMIFTVFMILIGIQRYSIEQWRSLSGRDTYKIFGMAFRQSEIISIVLFTIGVLATAYLYRYYKLKKHPQ